MSLYTLKYVVYHSCHVRATFPVFWKSAGGSIHPGLDIGIVLTSPLQPISQPLRADRMRAHLLKYIA